MPRETVKRKWGEKHLDAVLSLVAQCKTIPSACQQSGVPEATWWNWWSRDTWEAKARYARAKEKGKGYARQLLAERAVEILQRKDAKSSDILNAGRALALVDAEMTSEASEERRGTIPVVRVPAKVLPMPVKEEKTG